MICEDCDCRFDETDQNLSQWKFGQCPSCLSENIKEEGEMTPLEEAILTLWDEGIGVDNIILKLGLDEEDKDLVEDTVEAPANYGVMV